MAAVLPLDIVIEIFLRLPVMTIIRLKRVCKSWRTLITDPKYSHLHLQHSKASNNRFLILKSNFSYELLYRIDLDTLTTSPPLKITLFGNQKWSNLLIVGSWNGLVCLYAYEQPRASIVLLNPLTLTFSKFPDFETLKLDGFGFGFDSENDNYKFVSIKRIFKNYDYDNNYFPSRVRVFSFKDNSWKSINDGGFYARQCESSSWMIDGVLLDNHLLHWILHSRKSGKPVIACLDLCSEEWTEIDVPDSTFPLFKYNEFLSIYEDRSLCLISRIWFMSDVDVLVLKEYGMKDSWVNFRLSEDKIWRFFSRFVNSPMAFQDLADPHYSPLMPDWCTQICLESLVTVGDFQCQTTVGAFKKSNSLSVKNAIKILKTCFCS